MSHASSSSSSSSSSSRPSGLSDSTLDSVDSADLLSSIASGIRTRSQTRTQVSIQPDLGGQSLEDSAPISFRNTPTSRLNAIEPVVRELSELLPGLRSLLERHSSSPGTPSFSPSPTQSSLPQTTSVENLAIAMFARESTRLSLPEGKEEQLDHCQETIFRILRMTLDKLIAWEYAA